MVYDSPVSVACIHNLKSRRIRKSQKKFSVVSFSPISERITEKGYLVSRVVHFESPADNPEQVAGLYKKVPGWDILEMGRPVWITG